MIPAELQQKLEEKLNELATANEQYKDLYLDYIYKQNEYKKEYSKKYLEIKANSDTKMTINELDAKTTIETANLKLNSDIAEAVFKAHREAMSTLKIEIDTLRTLLSYQKAELERTEG